MHVGAGKVRQRCVATITICGYCVVRQRSLPIACFRLPSSLFLLQQLHHRTLRASLQLVKLGCNLALEVPVGFLRCHACQHILCVPPGVTQHASSTNDAPHPPLLLVVSRVAQSLVPLLEPPVGVRVAYTMVRTLPRAFSCSILSSRSA